MRKKSKRGRRKQVGALNAMAQVQAEGNANGTPTATTSEGEAGHVESSNLGEQEVPTTVTNESRSVTSGSSSDQSSTGLTTTKRKRLTRAGVRSALSLLHEATVDNLNPPDPEAPLGEGTVDVTLSSVQVRSSRIAIVHEELPVPVQQMKLRENPAGAHSSAETTLEADVLDLITQSTNKLRNIVTRHKQRHERAGVNLVTFSEGMNDLIMYVLNGDQDCQSSSQQSTTDPFLESVQSSVNGNDQATSPNPSHNQPVASGSNVDAQQVLPGLIYAPGSFIQPAPIPVYFLPVSGLAGTASVQPAVHYYFC